MDGTRRDDVVIVGLACRFPDADNPGQLWHSVLSRRLSFRPLPPGRWTPTAARTRTRRT